MELKEKTAIFIHIPKTAGSTINHILRQNYSYATHYHFNSMKIPEYWHAFIQKKINARTHYRCISGHMRFGIHNFLEGKDFAYFTFLRDPVQKVISFYQFAKRLKKHHWHEQVSSMSLSDFVASGLTKDVQNGAAAKICGFTDPIRLIPAEPNLQAAIDIIERFFPVVAIAERFDESILMLKQVFQWYSIFYKARNVNPNKKKYELSDEEMETIKHYNSIDIDLYNYAIKRFNESVINEGPKFQNQLNRFRRINHYFGGIIGKLNVAGRKLIA